MYQCSRDNIVDGNEFFPISWILCENIIYLTMWVMAGYLLWPIWNPFDLPMLTIVWVILVAVIQVLLKKHNCSGCYYYDKPCHLGWGKISSAMFQQDSGDPKTGMKLTFFYILPPPLIFLASLIYSIVNRPISGYWIILALYTILNLLSFPIRKKGCGLCAMREGCPGSAAKSK